MVGETVYPHADPATTRSRHNTPPAMASVVSEARPIAQAPMADHYTPTGPARETADYRAQLLEKQYQLSFGELRERIAGLLSQQGIATDHLQRMSPEEAAAAVAEDGYWGVEQTASRIFDFAVAASGGDISKLQAIKDAVLKGYEQAKNDLGGWLPDIASRTIERVMERLDAWAESVEAPPV